MSACAVRFLVVFLSVFFSAAQFAAAQESRSIVTTDNADYFGFDLRAEKEVTLDQCKAACLADNACRAFTYNTKASWCFLKSDFSELKPFEGAIAGRIVTITAEADLGAPPALDFLPGGMAREARSYRDTLVKAADRYAGRGVDELMRGGESALRSGDGRRALSFFGAAASLAPENARAWTQLSRAVLMINPANGTERYQFQQTATSAAYNGYLASRTKTPRADALDVFAKALERRSQFRPALEAYKASLALVPSAAVRAAFTDLRAREGFRVVDNTTDANAATPRVCVQFSDPLVKSGVDYANYVTVNGKPPVALNAKDNQICVEGLAYGERYAVGLRAGLPAAIGETLLAPVTINAYIRDRQPSVRFTGDNFVLAQAGRSGIPLISVNASEADMKLYRIGDRAIARILANGDFLDQLSSYDAETVANSSGELVWQGVLEITPELNTDVTTSIPIDEALPKREPGVYVMTARAKGDREEDWQDQATQWFVISDIGLTSFSGIDGLTIFARSLESAGVLEGVGLKLIARNNDILGEGTTDANGRARFDPGLMRGRGGMAPVALLASSEGEGFVFLDLTRAGFDFSDRGVEGRPAPGAIDVQTWTERGIYRAGATVHAVALARDDSAQAIESLPLTFIFRRPDGVEHSRLVSATAVAGGHVVELALPQNAMRGAWQMRIFADPKGDVLAEHTFLVEDFVPDRIEFDLTSTSTVLDRATGVDVRVDGRYLYGAPATGLAIEGELTVATVRERDGFSGYQFGLDGKDEAGVTRIALDGLPRLDSRGVAEFAATLGTVPASTRPLEATVTVRMREGGGRAVERALVLPVKPAGTMIGVRPEFDGQVAEGSTASFKVITVTPDGARADLAGASWSLVKVSRNYQWYRQGSSWRYETVDFTTEIANGTIDIGTGDAASIAVPVDWGRYRLEVETSNADGPATSVSFDAGWYVEAASLDTPDGLEIALDKESYKAGETAKLQVSPRFAGELLVTVGSDSLLATHTATVPEGGRTVDIPVGDDWGAGAYVTATLLRPGSASESRMPLRAIGVKWLKIDNADRTLDVAIDAPEQTLPEQPFDVMLTVAGGTAGEPVYATVAAVDVGILNLTDYQVPDPAGWYYGRRKLGLEMRDIYGRLIDGSLGTAGRLRTGGDGPGMQSQGNPPKGKLVAFFSGPVQLDSEGKATVSFDMPQFNGTVRVMAAAWSASAVGSASKDSTVRSPVVVTAGMPRFMATGDSADLRLDIANTDGPAGDYTLSLIMDGPVALTGDLPQTVSLEKGGKAVLTIPVRASAPGVADIDVRLAHAGGTEVSHSLSFAVRPETLPVTTRMTVPLAANGGSVKIDRQLLAASIEQGASIAVSVSRFSGFDVPALLMSLDRYPYGCAEQTTSRALPLLYVSELSEVSGLAPDPDIKGRIEKAIVRVMAYQSSSGSFGMWAPGSGDLWLDAYVTDFLTRAREKGYAVPEQGMGLALDNLENELGYVTDVQTRGRDIAYALYVLARNRRAAAGDLRYYSDTRIGDFNSPMARAQLAAGLALYGDGARADRTFASAFALAKATSNVTGTGRNDFGSRLRDGAALVALAAESKPAPADVPQMIDFVAGQSESRRHTSTQEQAWMLLAARALALGGETIALDVDGTSHSGPFSRRLTGSEVASAPLTIANETGNQLTAVVTTVASPVQPLPAGGNGFTISRDYYTMDGAKTSVGDVTQNERYVAVVQVSELNDWPSHIVITDLLPAGFEVDNPAIVKSAELTNFDWLGDMSPAHVEFLDDRVVAAFSQGSGADRNLTVAYVVRAVSPGVYAHPAVTVEDMYRPQLSARTATGRMEVKAAQ